MSDTRENFIVDQYKKLRLFSFSRFSNEQNREDFRAYAIIKIIEGRKATFLQLYTDYLRESKGDSRSKYFELQRGIRSPEHYEGRCFEGSITPGEIQVGFDEITHYPGGASSPSYRISGRYITDLQGIDAGIAELYFMFGYSEKEIATEYCLTESRISQILKKIKSIIKYGIEKEIIEERKNEINFGIFDVEWLKI
jgi:hypothetical protein